MLQFKRHAFMLVLQLIFMISLAFRKQCRGEEMKPNKYKPSAITTDPPPPSSSTIVSSALCTT
ncbi:hypothetical protein HanHA89_Chr01g0020041 [Helianthus annuus]|nr:hypothetical protein HanHA89_Chr01g0020041 [Helianthus annuus]